MPCQEEALKDRSSMPPVSVTMQPRNLLAVAPEADPDALELALGACVLDPHAASSAMALTAAAVLRIALTDTSYVKAATALRTRASDSPQTILALDAESGYIPPKG
jgi:hypothetical protein